MSAIFRDTMGGRTGNWRHIVQGDHTLLLLGSAAAMVAVSALVWWCRRYAERKSPPRNWHKIAKVSALYLYPIKSCRGIRSRELECTPLGCRIGDMRDRMFVVVDEDGKFVTGRDHPRLTQVTATYRDGKLHLSGPNDAEPVEFALDSSLPRTELMQIRIWDALAEGFDCGDGVAQWLSRFVLNEDSGLRLLRYGNRDSPKQKNPRMVRVADMLNADFREKDSAFFSDALSYHLISESSVEELNSRLQDEKVTHLNFRPNIVVEGDRLIPFEEDEWRWVKIGDVVFRCIAPCTRCKFTTVIPEEGRKSEKMEPLKTLSKYRLVRDSAKRKLLASPVMGIYMGARSEGSIAVGDDVMIPAS